MKVKEQQLSSEVANIQTALDEFRGNESDISDRMDTIESTQTSQEEVIDEVNTEISGLKTEYIRVINKIKSL
jgi:chromosome segregation ATPase